MNKLMNEGYLFLRSLANPKSSGQTGKMETEKELMLQLKSESSLETEFSLVEA
jgi:hypothetical protein